MGGGATDDSSVSTHVRKNQLSKLNPSSVTNYSAMLLNDTRNVHQTRPVDNNMDRAEGTGRVSLGRMARVNLEHTALQVEHLEHLEHPVDTAVTTIERS